LLQWPVAKDNAAGNRAETQTPPFPVPPADADGRGDGVGVAVRILAAHRTAPTFVNESDYGTEKEFCSRRTFHGSWLSGPVGRSFIRKDGASWPAKTSTNCSPFEPMSKRRMGYPSEQQVKCGVRIVHSDKLLAEKLGRNDFCPCGSYKRFKKCCLKSGRF
jgi:hypothetical protein